MGHAKGPDPDHRHARRAKAVCVGLGLIAQDIGLGRHDDARGTGRASRLSRPCPGL